METEISVRVNPYEVLDNMSVREHVEFVADVLIEREQQVLNVTCERIGKATDGRISAKPYCDAEADGMDFGEDWGLCVNDDVCLSCVSLDEVYSFLDGMEKAVELLQD